MNRSEMAEWLAGYAGIFEDENITVTAKLLREAAAMLETPAVDCGPGEWIPVRWANGQVTIYKQTTSLRIIIGRREFAEVTRSEVNAIAAALDGQSVKWEE